MATLKPFPVPWPLSTAPGANPQEGSGRLINCSAEPLGDPQKPTGPALQVWRRQPGLSVHATTAQTGYRGGLIVNNLSFEVWSGNLSTVDVNGAVTSLGTITGTKQVSIARDQAASVHVVIVDVDNGAFSSTGGGAPAAYNGGGVLPQPNSVCFQDGYFFFTIGDGRCFASGINALTQNANTFINAQAKSDVTLLRGIAYAGVLWLFTTGHCEIWQDTAAPFPAFPYTRQLVIEYGLVQQAAIAGWETGFSELLWVAQDFGVYWATPGSFAPVKVSSPDLEKLIETAVRAGDTLRAGCYAFAGKKFWHISSSSWTWEFNITTKKWNERWSLGTNGLWGRWRGVGGHPAFGRWLLGDAQDGTLAWIDSTQFTELGQPQLFRMESGPVKDFPNQIRIARADFDFDMGVGIAAGLPVTVTGAANNGSGKVRLTLTSTAGLYTGESVNISGIVGTTEANVATTITVVDAIHVDLPSITFVNAYTSGGILTPTPPDIATRPNCAISCSKDGAVNWGNPLVRSLGQQMKTKRVRASVKSLGLSSPAGDRWRVDVTDPVYTALLGATQSSNPREVGA